MPPGHFNHPSSEVKLWNRLSFPGSGNPVQVLLGCEPAAATHTLAPKYFFAVKCFCANFESIAACIDWDPELRLLALGKESALRVLEPLESNYLDKMSGRSSLFSSLSVGLLAL